MAVELARARALIEEVIRGLGVMPEAALAKADVRDVTWTVQRGAAKIVVTLATRPSRSKPGEQTYLRVVSPVLTLDAHPKDAPKGEHEPLYRHLLELNAAGLANAAFGLIDDRVVVVSERPTDDLQASEINQMIRHLATVAAAYDEKLRTTFGAHATPKEPTGQA